MRKYLTYPVICIMMSSLCGASFKTGDTQMPKVSELLDQYEATQKRIYPDCIMEFEAEIDAYRSYTSAISKGQYQSKVKIHLRTDGDQWYWVRELSDQCYASPGRIAPEADPRVRKALKTDTHLITADQEPNIFIKHTASQYAAKSSTMPMKDFIRSRKLIKVYDKPENEFRYTHYTQHNHGQMQYYFPDMVGGGGFFYDPDLIHRLRNAQTLRLLPKTETVNGSKCFVIMAEYKRVVQDAGKQDINVTSKIKVWIDPEHDYNISRSQEKTVTVAPGNPASTVIDTTNSVSFSKVDGLWVPMEWDVTHKRDSSKPKYTCSKSRIKRTQCILAPDHEKRKSFALDKRFLPDDTWGVRMNGFNGIDSKTDYIWDNGRVMDRNGKSIFDFKESLPR